MTNHKIAVIAGDGIGKEVIPAGIAAIEKAARGTSVSLSFSDLPWSCEYYLAHQRMMDEDGYERMAKFDALYMGALGAPGVPDAASAGKPPYSPFGVGYVFGTQDAAELFLAYTLPCISAGVGGRFPKLPAGISGRHFRIFAM